MSTKNEETVTMENSISMSNSLQIENEFAKKKNKFKKIIYIILAIIFFCLAIYFFLWKTKSNNLSVNHKAVSDNVDPNQTNNMQNLLKINMKEIKNLFNDQKYQNEKLLELIKNQNNNLYESIKQIISIMKENSKLYNTSNIIEILEALNQKNISQNNEGTNLIYKSIYDQNDFCKNPKKYLNKKLEKSIIKSSAKYSEEIKFDMYTYINGGAVSKEIQKNHVREKDGFDQIHEAIKFYAKKKNIKNNNDITVLDLGANLGIYTFSLGYLGYRIIAFEPNINNFYLLSKSYCLNQNQNVILVNKGLYSEEKTFTYYDQNKNLGNGLISDSNKEQLLYFKKSKQQIETVKLSRFYEYLKDKNLAAIKIDIEGAEEQAFKGGIELLTKYHVPFILLEFSHTYLKIHNSNPEEFYNLFINNGYKIYNDKFFNKVEASFKDIRDNLNIYIVHKSMLE